MDTACIRKLYEYDRWANARTLGAVAKLSSDQFTRDLGSSHRSVRDTLVHNFSAGRIWLARWNSSPPMSMVDPAAFPTLAAVRAAWAELERELGHFLHSVSDERLRAVIAYTNIEGKPFAQLLWEQMVHVVNHASYHRGQITTLLRQLGAEPAATDLIVFFREQPAR